LVLPDRLLTDWLTHIPVLALELGAALSVVMIQAVSGVQPGREIVPVVELGADSRAETTAGSATDRTLGQQNASNESESSAKSAACKALAWTLRRRVQV